MLAIGVMAGAFQAEAAKGAGGYGVPALECGDYRVEGRLRSNNLGQFVLVVREGSTSAHELIVLGGAIREKLERVGTEISVEVYVPRPVRSNERPYVYSLSPLTPAAPKPADPRLLRRSACGQSKRFRAG